MLSYKVYDKLYISLKIETVRDLKSNLPQDLYGRNANTSFIVQDSIILQRTY